MKIFSKQTLSVLFTIIFCVCAAFAQAETLSNKDIILLTKSGLDKTLIVQKIKDSNTAFDISVNGLVELKNSGVDDEVIKAVMERSTKTAEKIVVETSVSANDSESRTEIYAESKPTANFANPKEVLLSSKTVAINKSSLNPSRQALEKELLKRKDWQKLNLNIVRYKEGADLRIEIGRVPLSWITHRYVFRVYDNKSGTVLAAGETTSWGSLAKNLAREITQKLDAVSN